MALAQRRPSGMYRWLANAPRWFYRLSLGWLLGKRVVQLTHRGRTSGLVRQTILEVLHFDCPSSPRELAWQLWQELIDDPELLPSEEVLISEVTLEDIPQVAAAMLHGKTKGRTLVQLT